MIQGAIFDLDGTILDSMSIWDSIGEDYLRSLGKEPEGDLKETFKTFTLEQSARYYREHCGVDLSVPEIIDGINHMIESYYVYTVPLKPGAEVFLKMLKERGVKMCIATVTDRKLTEAALDRLKIGDFFSRIFTCAEVGHSKKHPHIYRKALKYLETEKRKTVVFEDTLHALETAKADGFPTCAVYDSHEDKQEKLMSIADFYIRDYFKAADSFASQIL